MHSLARYWQSAARQDRSASTVAQQGQVCHPGHLDILQLSTAKGVRAGSPLSAVMWNYIVDGTTNHINIKVAVSESTPALLGGPHKGAGTVTDDTCRMDIRLRAQFNLAASNI